MGNGLFLPLKQPSFLLLPVPLSALQPKTCIEFLYSCIAVSIEDLIGLSIGIGCVVESIYVPNIMHNWAATAWLYSFCQGWHLPSTRDPCCQATSVKVKERNESFRCQHPCPPLSNPSSFPLSKTLCFCLNHRPQIASFTFINSSTLSKFCSFSMSTSISPSG